MKNKLILIKYEFGAKIDLYHNNTQIANFNYENCGWRGLEDIRELIHLLAKKFNFTVEEIDR